MDDLIDGMNVTFDNGSIDHGEVPADFNSENIQNHLYLERESNDSLMEFAIQYLAGWEMSQYLPKENP